MKTQSVSIDLPKGGTVEVEYTEALLEQIREKLQLDPTAEISHDMLRSFLIVELSSALEKAGENA